MEYTFKGLTFEEHLAAFKAEQPEKYVGGFAPSNFRETTFFFPEKNQTVKCIVLAEAVDAGFLLVYVLQAAEGETFLFGKKYFLMDKGAWQETAG